MAARQAGRAAFAHARIFTCPKRMRGGAPDLYARVLSRKKANYALREDQLKLRWQDGVLIPEGADNTGIIGSIKRREAELVFLDLLAAVTSEGRSVSDNSHAANFAPKLFAQRPERHGHSKPDIARAMERLFAAHQITMQEYGRKGDMRKKIVRCGDQPQAIRAGEATPFAQAAE
jgi:hypothetical protein